MVPQDDKVEAPGLPNYMFWSPNNKFWTPDMTAMQRNAMNRSKLGEIMGDSSDNKMSPICIPDVSSETKKETSTEIISVQNLEYEEAMKKDMDNAQKISEKVDNVSSSSVGVQILNDFVQMSTSTLLKSWSLSIVNEEESPLENSMESELNVTWLIPGHHS